MSFATDSLKQKVAETFQDKITSFHPLGGTGIYHTAFEHHPDMVVKTGKHCYIEGKMLIDLGKHLLCADVLHLDDSFLAMEYLEESRGYDESDVAYALAKLHSHPAPHFGYTYDTTIGSFQQPNPRYDSWIGFYREQRILYMAEACYRESRISTQQYHQLTRLCERFETLLSEPPYPSLIHGDIWSGNVLAKNGQPVFIDPAIYWAHPECELGFLKMFHTFGDRFYAAYEEIRPLDSGFYGEREELYMLYWVLVHVRAFGSGYIPGMERIVSRFL